MKQTGYRQLKKMRLHFMGIGGQGISAVAQMALQAGATVSGCDQASSATTKMLARLGIPIELGHSPEHLAEAEALIYVPAAVALNPNNPELLAAREKGLLVMTWQEMLGQWLEGYCLLSVSGVHGKGTTTAMLALALLEAGLDPTCEIGAVVPRVGRRRATTAAARVMAVVHQKAASNPASGFVRVAVVVRTTATRAVPKAPPSCCTMRVMAEAWGIWSRAMST